MIGRALRLAIVLIAVPVLAAPGVAALSSDTKTVAHSPVTISTRENGIAFLRHPGSAVVNASGSRLSQLETFVLRGTLWNYRPARPSVAGSITIRVNRGTVMPREFAGRTFTFSVNSSTKIVVAKGKRIRNGDRGTIKLATRISMGAGVAALAIIDQTTTQPGGPITTLPPVRTTTSRPPESRTTLPPSRT